MHVGRQRRSTELPDNFAGFPVDDDDGRDVTKAQDDVAVWQLGYTIAMRPLFPLILYRRNAIRLWIEVLPSPPFPNYLPGSCHLDEIISVHLPVVLRARHAAFDSSERDPAAAELSKSAVRCRYEPYAIVMMIGLPDFPQHTTIPIDFKRGAALPRSLADKAF